MDALALRNYDYTVNSHHTNLLAAGLHACGKMMTYPVSHLFLEQSAKVVRSIEPGHLDQASTKGGEVIFRCFRIAICIVTLPPVVCLGVIGGSLRSLATRGRGEFVYLCPEASPRDQVIGNISITTFNVRMMPPCVDLVTNYSSARDRVRAAVKGVLESGSDVFCAQEVFNMEVADEFVALIRLIYPFVIYHAGCRSIGINSGLLIASKFPIVNPEYWEHSQKIGIERLSGKGSLAVRVQPNPGQSIFVINSHLEACVSDLFQARVGRFAQLTEIERKAKGYRRGAEPAFLCGDLNIASHGEETNPDYLKLGELIRIDRSEMSRSGSFYYTNLPRVHIEADAACDCLVRNPTFPGSYDHIGVLKPATTNETPIESRRSCFYGASDHIALTKRFDLAKWKED